MRSAMILALAGALTVIPYAQAAQSGPACGEVRTVCTHDGSATRYAYASAPEVGRAEPATALLLLAGGSGFLKLDENGCPRALKNNSLVRSIPLFAAAGFATALVDAPSDWQGEDGLGGFRVALQHAQDLGKIIRDLRARGHAQVWVIGTSRGSISAVNAATRLTGSAAPDGVVLTSALMVGASSSRINWLTQTVFDLPLENLHMPLLLIGHAFDLCVRSPAASMHKIAQRSPSRRQQLVTITGGAGSSGLSSVEACEARSPHGYLGQEAQVVDGIARFIRGSEY